MLAACGRPDGGNDAAADTELCKGAELGTTVGSVLPNGRKKAHHAFLNEVFAVTASQEKGAGTHPHKAGMAQNKCFLSSTVAHRSPCA